MHEEGGVATDDSVLRVLGLQPARQRLVSKKFTPQLKARAAPAAPVTEPSASSTQLPPEERDEDSSFPAAESITITIPSISSARPPLASAIARSTAESSSFHRMDSLIEAIRVAPKTPNLFDDTLDTPPSGPTAKKPTKKRSRATPPPPASDDTNEASNDTREHLPKPQRTSRKKATIAKVAGYMNMASSMQHPMGDDVTGAITADDHHDHSLVVRSKVLPESFGDVPYHCFNVYLSKTDDGLGLRLRNVEEKAVIAAVKRRTDEADLRPNDVIVAVNELDAIEAPFSKMVHKLLTSDGVVCIRIARSSCPISVT